MRKLIVFLTVLSLIFMSVAPSVFAAFTPVNVGPDTDFDGDINIPAGSDYYKDSTLLAITDLTTADLITEAMLDGVAGPADEDILTYETDSSEFEWHTPAELTLVTWTGTAADTYVAVWTANGDIEGVNDFTYDGSNLQFTGDLGSTGAYITKGWFTDLIVTNDIDGDILGNAVTITVTDDENQAEENEVTFVADAGTPGADKVLESDSGFTYNPSTGTLTATAFAGNVTGNLTGNADTFEVTDNESEALACPVIFVDGATGAQGAESDDTDFTYNPSTGTLKVTIFDGSGQADFASLILDTALAVAEGGTGVTTAAMVNFETIYNNSLMVGRDTSNDMDWSVDDHLTWTIAGNAVDLVNFATGAGSNDMLATKGYVDDLVGGSKIMHFMDMGIADQNFYINQDTTDAGELYGSILNQSVYARNVTTFGDASGAGQVTVTGTLADGTVGATEVIVIGVGATAGAKAFMNITGLLVADTSTGTYDIGIGDILGLPSSFDHVDDVYQKVVDGVDEFHEISGNTNTTNNTINCATIVANEDITIYYHN